MNSIGERIYELRKQNNMSQGDLADKLNVSRQTVSKWENNSSVPELDKLIALSDTFSVTTDYIIKGKKKENAVPLSPPTEKEKVIIIEKGKSFDGKKFFAIGLLLVSVLLFFIMPTMFYYPLWLAIIGVILLVCKKHGGFFVAWYSYITVTAFCLYATAINMFSLFNINFYRLLNFNEPSFSQIIVLIADFVLLISLVLLLWWTYRVIKNRKAEK